MIHSGCEYRIENCSTGSTIKSNGANHSSLLVRTTFRNAAFTKLAFDSPRRFRATSTVAETAA